MRHSSIRLRNLRTDRRSTNSHRRRMRQNRRKTGDIRTAEREILRAMAGTGRTPCRVLARIRTTIRIGRRLRTCRRRSSENSAICRRRSAEDSREQQQYRNLPPAQKEELNRRAEQWGRMTPQQRSTFKNDVLPKWKQMPQDRRQAIQQRLRVLQNMPESARNQRLNDPEFTRGMSDEDKATLRDLSHLHVGGAPDPPGE